MASERGTRLQFPNLVLWLLILVIVMVVLIVLPILTK